MNPWAIVGVLLLLIAVAFGAYRKGDASGAARVQVSWDADKLKRSEDNGKAVLAAVAKNEVKHAEELAKTQKVITNYETALDIKNAVITAERRDAQRLRVTIDRASICNRTSTASQATGTKPADEEGDQVTFELPKEIERSIQDLTEDADRQIAIRDEALAGLRAWIIAQGFYGPEPTK